MACFYPGMRIGEGAPPPLAWPWIPYCSKQISSCAFPLFSAPLTKLIHKIITHGRKAIMNSDLPVRIFQPSHKITKDFFAGVFAFVRECSH